MANKKLSQAEIAKRLTRLRNLEQLHRLGKQRRRLLEELMEAQAAQLAHFEQIVAEQNTMLATQAVRIAELEAMVFGKKKKPSAGTLPAKDNRPDAPPKQPRGKDSYRRPVPADEAVTGTVEVPLPEACACGGHFTNVTSHDRYEEDIPLPGLTSSYTARLVTRYKVAQGQCGRCGQTASGRDLGGAVVSLGMNVRLLICHLVAKEGLSYSQTASLLLGLYGIAVSDGEVTNIFQKQHERWLPAYEQLKADIRAAPSVHGDETPWAIQSLEGHGYAWVLADSTSPKVCFALENSRGVCHAKKLFGVDTDQPFAGVRISDDYGAYRALPGQQQLCWAHLYRCIRDLRYNDNLPESQLSDVDWWYGQFAAIYQALRQYLTEPYDGAVRRTQADELWGRLQALLPEADGEPDKLRKLKAQLKRAGPDKLFVCLPADTPCDNNRAERELRQLVLKRKRSFGSKTQKGAQALATILSICTTTWRSSPQGYFRVLAGVGV